MGYSERQPGGWVFNLLPYVEEATRRNIGAGETFDQKKLSRVTLASLPFTLFVCPTRRGSAKFSNAIGYFDKVNINYTPTVGARGDYAINAGSQPRNQIYAGPATIEEGLDPNSWPDVSDHNGISYQRSLVRHKDVTDGTSITYLVGERYVNKHEYYSGEDPADNSHLYTGYEDDNHRDTSELPASDMADLNMGQAFGSAHSGAFNISACDGSVRSVSYGVDATVHRNLGSRTDGNTVRRDEW